MAVGGQAVHAADGDTGDDTTGDVLEMNSKGTFSVTAGNLKLTEVPDLDFGKFTIKQVTDGASNDLTNPGENLTVSDYRGKNNADWTLSAKTSAFKNADDTNEIEGAITLATNTPGAAGALDGTEIWSSKKAETNGASEKTATTSDSSKLTLEGQPDKAMSGEYTADVTWTLNDTPTDGQAS